MRSGDTLIRLAKHKVDSVQKLIAAAEETRAGVCQKRDDLMIKAERERANAQRDVRLMGEWAAYSKIVANQMANLDASLSGIDQQLDALRGDLQIAFEEQKKFEMLEDRRLARAKLARDKRQQAFMDETAVLRAAREAG
jgi:flagellar protein FliJ